MDSFYPPERSSDEAGPSLVPDIVPEFFCDPCLEDGNHIQAEGYCVDCAHHLCGTCFLHHCTPRPLRHHQLLDKHQMPKSKSDKVYKDECTDKCTTHGEEILRYFCEDHKLFACSICVSLGHRTCNVGYIPTLSGDIFDSQEYDEFKRDLESLARTTKSLQEAATRNLEYISQHAERAIEKIRELRKEIATFFDGLEQGILDRVTKIQSKDQKKIETLSKQCEVLAGKIKNLEADIEDKESKHQKCRLFVDVKDLQDTIEKYKNDISKMEKTNTIKDLTFRPSEEISILIRDQSAQFGSVVDFCQTTVASLPSDGTCDITGIAVLSDGRIAVIDTENSCIKVIDTTRDRVIMSKGLPKGYVYRITAVSDTKIALGRCCEIKLYSVTDQIKLTKHISISNHLKGFVYNNNMFISLLDHSSFFENIFKLNPVQWFKVCMVNMNGNVVKTFPSQIDGEKLFIHPQYIAVSPDQTAIYVSDSVNDTVTCLTFDGEVKSRYKYSNSWSPQGVAVSRDGLVYVCDCMNNNIHILTSDLEEMGLIVGEKYGVFCPQGLGYCARDHKLYVGMRNDSTIRVFDLKHTLVTRCKCLKSATWPE